MLVCFWPPFRDPTSWRRNKPRGSFAFSASASSAGFFPVAVATPFSGGDPCCLRCLRVEEPYRSPETPNSWSRCPAKLPEESTRTEGGDAVAGLIITRGLFLAVLGQALTRPSPVRLRPGSGCSQAGGFDASASLSGVGAPHPNKLNGGAVILHSSHNGFGAGEGSARVVGFFLGVCFFDSFWVFWQAPSQSASRSVSRRARLSQSESQSVGQCLSVGQSSVEPRARQSVSQSVGASVGTRARRFVSRSVGRLAPRSGQSVSRTVAQSVRQCVRYMMNRYRQMRGRV